VNFVLNIFAVPTNLKFQFIVAAKFIPKQLLQNKQMLGFLSNASSYFIHLTKLFLHFT